MKIKAKRFTILIHRWMGVTFCGLFALWFVSGVVMMYWDYPGVSSERRMARSAPLDSAKIRVTPQQAWANLEMGGRPDQVRLMMLDGRPLYRFRIGRSQTAVWADSGQEMLEIDQAQALRIAAAFTGQPTGAARFEGMNTEEDQWTVSQSFAPLRPMFQFSWPDGEEVYVSQLTAEVAQHTTRGSRIGAYFGAIPHWLYFTPLRKDGALWSKIVVWSSGIGTVMSLFGLAVGVWLYSPGKRYRFPDGARYVPYAGQKRWHLILGLFFGLVTCTWVFSGMLSMGPFEFLERGPGGARLNQALRSGRLTLASFTEKTPQAALAEVEDQLLAKEMEMTSFAGDPIYLAYETPQRSRVIPVKGGAVPAFSPDRVLRILAKSSEPYQLAEFRIVERYEAYYIARHGERPLPVLFARLNDPGQSMYYIDLKTARVVEAYGPGSRWNRWLYHGLHSFDLPWLYRYRPLWDITVLLLMGGGTALSVTSLVIAWRRINQKSSMWRVARQRRRAAATPTTV